MLSKSLAQEASWKLQPQKIQNHAIWQMSYSLANTTIQNPPCLGIEFSFFKEWSTLLLSVYQTPHDSQVWQEIQFLSTILQWINYMQRMYVGGWISNFTNWQIEGKEVKYHRNFFHWYFELNRKRYVHMYECIYIDMYL